MASIDPEPVLAINPLFKDGSVLAIFTTTEPSPSPSPSLSISKNDENNEQEESRPAKDKTVKNLANFSCLFKLS